MGWKCLAYLDFLVLSRVLGHKTPEQKHGLLPPAAATSRGSPEPKPVRKVINGVHPSKPIPYSLSQYTLYK